MPVHFSKYNQQVNKVNYKTENYIMGCKIILHPLLNKIFWIKFKCALQVFSEEGSKFAKHTFQIAWLGICTFTR